MVSNMFIFHNIWDNPSHWLICFKMVKTTNFPSESFVVSVPSLGLEGVLPSLQKPSSKSQAAMESTTRVHSALHLRGSRGRVATRGHRRHQNASDAGDLTYLLKMAHIMTFTYCEYGEFAIYSIAMLNDQRVVGAVISRKSLSCSELVGPIM